MNHTRTAAALIGLLLLTACSSTTEPGPPPPSTSFQPPSPSESPTATLSLPAHKAWCTEELIKRKEQEGTIPSEPRPVACLGLGNSDFLSAYTEALMEANRKALEERRKAREEKAAQSEG